MLRIAKGTQRRLYGTDGKLGLKKEQLIKLLPGSKPGRNELMQR